MKELAAAGPTGRTEPGRRSEFGKYAQVWRMTGNGQSLLAASGESS